MPFGVGWVYRNWGASDWGNKWVVVRKCIGQIWWSGPKELRVSMGAGMCIAGDHLRHGTEYLVYFWAACLYCYERFGPVWYL